MHWCSLPQKMRSSISSTPLSQLPTQLYYQMAVTSLMLLHHKLTRMFATNHTLLWMTTIIDLTQMELTTMNTADNTSCCTSFRNISELLFVFPIQSEAYQHCLTSDNLPPSFEEDVHWIEQQQQQHQPDEHAQPTQASSTTPAYCCH